MLSLDDYAAAMKPPGCGVCALPPDIVAVIHENEQREQPWSRPVVAAWVKEQTGSRISPDTLYRHFVNNH